MRTTCRLDRDRHGAGRAVLRNWRGGRRRPLQLVHRFDHEKNADRDDDEVDHERDKISVVPSPAPALAASAGVLKEPPPGAALRMRNLLEKSRPPVSKPTGGMRMSLTSELMIPPKAAPIITPTARSTAFPLIANSLNSFHIAVHRTNRRQYLQAFWGPQSRCALCYRQFAPESWDSTTRRFSFLHPLQQSTSSFDRAPFR